MFAAATCFGCKQPFTFNPELVPSLRINAEGQPDPNGEKVPICRTCIERANVTRAKAGLPPHTILPGAYEPQEEA
jgi:hypothetical protein